MKSAMVKHFTAACLLAISACTWHSAMAEVDQPGQYALLSRSGPVRINITLTPEQTEWLNDKHELILGTSAPDYPPFDMTASGRDYEGLTADYAGLLSNTLDIPIRVERFANREDAVRALTEGRIDLLGSANGYEAGAQGVVLSHPYAIDQPVLVTREDESRPLNTGLANLRLSMVYHYLPLDEVRTTYPKATTHTYVSYQHALNAVAFDQADVFLGDTISTHYMINQGYLQNVKMANFGKHEPVGFSFALRSDNQMLLGMVNTTLSAVSSATRERIFQRWSAGSGVLLSDRKLQLSKREERWLGEHPVVRVVVNENAAPLTFFDSSGNFRGIAADLLELIRLRTGLRFEVQRTTGISDMIHRIDNNNADVIAAISPSAERDATLAISRPYLENSYVLVTRKGSDQPTSLEQLQGKRVALTRGSTVINLLRQRFPTIQLVETESTSTSTSLLAQGQVDGTITALINANFSMASEPDLIIRSTVGAEPSNFSMATAKGAQELSSILDKALLSITPEELGVINSRWRGYSAGGDSYWRNHQRLIVQIILGTAALLLLSLAWNAWMRRQIKQREAAERALNDQLAFMRAMVNGTPHPIYVRDRQGLLQTCNESYLEALEAKAEAVLGKPVPSGGKGGKRQARKIHADYEMVMKQGTPLIGDRPLLLKDRQLTIYHWILPYRDSLGEVQGIIGGWIDISERRQLIEDLRLAKKQADEANRAKSTFLATMSHEIRTPMNAVIGMLELALKRAEKGQLDQLAIEVAHNSATDLLALIGDILDIARIESGHLSLAPERVNLAELVESVGRVFDGLARQKGLRLNMDIAINAQRDVLLDPLRFKQILSNLVSNAIKFTERGHVTVHVSLYPNPGGSGLTLEMSVQDTGIGISQSDQQRLFHPFAQVSPESQLARSGTGLGLVISRNLCEMMGGRLILHSQPGHGTDVQVSMPLTGLEACTETQAPEPETPAVPAELSVLVVDDHPANLLLMAQQLDYLGVRHTSAEDGLSGLHAWKQGHFDVLIIDCNMPRMNGYQLAQAIREHEQQHGLTRCTLWGYTANAQPEARGQCLQAGMDDCLLKPISLRALGQRLAQAPLLPHAPHVANVAELDLERLEPVVGSSRSDLRRLLEQLLQSNQRDRQTLLELDTQGSPEALMDHAHKVLGAARIVQASALMDACEQLEHACSKNAQEPVIRRRRQRLLREMQTFELALQEKITELSTVTSLQEE